jgi:hypothetical protein
MGRGRLGWSPDGGRSDPALVPERVWFGRERCPQWWCRTGPRPPYIYYTAADGRCRRCSSGLCSDVLLHSSKAVSTEDWVRQIVDASAPTREEGRTGTCFSPRTFPPSVISSKMSQQEGEKRPTSLVLYVLPSQQYQIAWHSTHCTFPGYRSCPRNARARQTAARPAAPAYPLGLSLSWLVVEVHSRPQS